MSKMSRRMAFLEFTKRGYDQGAEESPLEWWGFEVSW
jgi:hypothetical protein